MVQVVAMVSPVELGTLVTILTIFQDGYAIQATIFANTKDEPQDAVMMDGYYAPNIEPIPFVRHGTPRYIQITPAIVDDYHLVLERCQDD